MAEPESIENEQNEKKSGGALGIIIWILIALVTAGGGFAVPYLFPNLVGASSANSPRDGTPAFPMPDPNRKPAFIEFGDITVNLDEGRMTRYLRISITLQVDKVQEEQVKELIETKKYILKNWLLSYLSDKELDEIRGAAGQNRLRREIQDYFNTVLFADGYDRIHDILFEEFNVQ